MHKFIKQTLTVFCICMITVCCACSAKPLKTSGGDDDDKEFSKSGMTITLTDGFVEKDLVSQTAYYESTKAIVTALKEEFSLFEQAGYEDMTLEEYGNLVLTTNSFDTEMQHKNGLSYFTYEKSVSGKDFKYFATVFEGSDAFWLIQFASEQKNFDTFQPKFEKWANSVKFTEPGSKA